jgi:hypothetical protein
VNAESIIIRRKPGAFCGNWGGCQRPVGRALERDEKKIRQWKQKRWPELKKKPAKKGEPSSSSTKAD